jgi:hypothetical protein
MEVQARSLLATNCAMAPVPIRISGACTVLRFLDIRWKKHSLPSEKLLMAGQPSKLGALSIRTLSDRKAVKMMLFYLLVRIAKLLLADEATTKRLKRLTYVYRLLVAGEQVK